MTTTDDSPADVPARPCTTCGAGLAGDQDWCLECGSAQPGRLGGRAGWRAALTVLGVTGLLATGAGAAAYAALSSEAQRQAAAPPPPGAAPQVAQVPPQTAPPATAERTPTVEAPDSEPADVPEPSGDDAASAEDAPAATPSGDAGAGRDGADGGRVEPVEPAALDLPADAASTYDPYARGADQVGDPADALDGRRSTAWEAPVGPEGEVRIGLAVSLEEAQALSRVALRADTPGFTVEVYGTRAAELPPDVLDARWKNLGSRRDAGLRERFTLDGRFRHVLLWFTAQPADTIVRIPEVQLFDK